MAIHRSFEKGTSPQVQEGGLVFVEGMLLLIGQAGQQKEPLALTACASGRRGSEEQQGGKGGPGPGWGGLQPSGGSRVRLPHSSTQALG